MIAYAVNRETEAAPAMMELKIRDGIELGNLTDVGCHRSHNEDYYCYAEPESDAAFARKGRLLVIADGMGGHRGGAAASGIAVDTVRSAYLASDAETPAGALSIAVQEAHRAIQNFAREHPELEGMGTTCIAAVVKGAELTYAHVGDSRLFLVRGKDILQLTEDQTVVNRLIHQGMIAADEAAKHPDHSVLIAALGIGDAVIPEIPERPIPLAAGDILVLCTDGLHDLVDKPELAASVMTESPATACRNLIELAKSRGGHDNITVQILKVR